MLIYSSPRLIAVSHVLLRLLMPRHSPYALFRLNFLNRSTSFIRSIMRCPSSQIIILRLCYSPYFALLAKFVVINYTITERPSDFFRHTFLFQGIKKWSFLIICSFLFSLFGFQWTARSSCEVLFTATSPPGGDDRDRTDYLLNAIQALSQVSYAPVYRN